MTDLTVQLRSSHGREDPKDISSIWGGNFLDGGTWEELLECYHDDFHPHLEALKQFVVDQDLIGTTGEDQNDWWFKFSDGKKVGFTWRAWGDFMQALVGKKEGYMKYYMEAMNRTQS